MDTTALQQVAQQNGEQKKILMLGASMYQTYAIKEAVRQGHHVITCDYLPENPGHKYGHEYHNLSTTDRQKVLELAQNLKVDGVVAYASDPAAPVAAFVCEKLGLPTNPLAAIETLSRKDLFRAHQDHVGLNSPKWGSYTTYEDALSEIDTFEFPLIVKPVDSSGSKGISKLYDKAGLRSCVDNALSHSRVGKFIVEEFIQKKGYQISGDAFSIDGKLVFHCFGNEYHSKAANSSHAPLGECFPLFAGAEISQKVVAELQKLIVSLGMGTSAYNVEAIVDSSDNVYLLECAARSGGSLIPQLTKLATGVDMVPYVIKAALGEDCSDIKMAEVKGYWSNYMVHSDKAGIYNGIWFDESFLNDYIVEYAPIKRIGNEVREFRDSSDCIGELLLRFPDKETMQEVLKNIDKYIRVKIR